VRPGNDAAGGTRPGGVVGGTQPGEAHGLGRGQGRRAAGGGAWPGKVRGQGESAGGGRKRERRGGERGEAHLGARRSWQPSTGLHLGQRRWKRGGREGEGNCCAGNENEIERGKGRAWGEVGAPGAGLGHGPDRGPGRKPTAHTTTNRKKNANKKPKRDGARLNTTSDKRNMLRHDATTMST
jgi:hypothetical protein